MLKTLPTFKHLLLHFRAPLMDRENEPWLKLGCSRESYGLSNTGYLIVTAYLAVG